MRSDRAAPSASLPRPALIGAACAAAWAALAVVFYVAIARHTDAGVLIFMALAAAALGPIVIILLCAWAGSEAASANRQLIVAPASLQSVAAARDLAADLRKEIEALGAVVLATVKRLDAFERGLRQDGGALALSLASDVEKIERARKAVYAETLAVGEPIAAHASALREAASRAHQKAPTPAKQDALPAAITDMKRQTPANEPAFADLAAIVGASGVTAADALSAEALDRVARSARQGPHARRETVRRAAPQALRKVSAYLRRDAAARRDAESLRRKPALAFGDPGEGATRRRALANAYLLIDTVLG